jgi:hypothetical protein
MLRDALSLAAHRHHGRGSAPTSRPQIVRAEHPLHPVHVDARRSPAKPAWRLPKLLPTATEAAAGVATTPVPPAAGPRGGASAGGNGGGRHAYDSTRLLIKFNGQ